MKKLLLACALAASAALAAEPPPVAALASPALLSGKFTQEKIIVGLKKPLASRGDFLVARDKGVIWRTQKPFAGAVAVTSKGIWSLKEKDGKPARSPIHQGNLGVAMEMIQKVLAGDPASLKKAFMVAESGEAGKWAMDLKPSDPVVSRVIKTIRLEGGRHVDRVEYLESNGDRTRIVFSDIMENAGELGSWQAIAFGD